MVKLGKMLRSVGVGRREAADNRVVQRAGISKGSRAALADRLPADERLAGLASDTGGGWARPEYGRYMATSPSVYAAIKLRADALTRPPLRVYRTGESGGRRTAVEPSHPAARLLDRVNIAHRTRHRPDALSRGEMQRAALARALANRPDVLFADEPTANLDRRNAGILWELIGDLHRDEGLTVVAATHNVEAIPEERRIVRLDDGRIASDEHG